jgi:hypothetical protein
MFPELNRSQHTRGEFMRGKCLVAAAIVSMGAANFASADIIWSNTGSGIEGVDVFSSSLQSPLLEDGFFAGDPGPFSVTGIRLGYDNTGLGPVNADVLVSFWDTVNYDVDPATSPIASGQIGSTLRFNFIAQTGAGDTGMLILPNELLFGDNSFGVIVNFVAPDTNTPMAELNHLFKDIPVTTGTSDGLFAYDFDLNGTIDGTEVFQWADGPFPNANLFMEIQGAAVPEPASAMLMPLGGLALLRRRRA